MIRLTKNQLRDLRTVIRKLLGRRHAEATIEFVAEPGHAVLRVRSESAAVAYRIDGPFEPATFALPVSALTEPKGRGKADVEFVPADGSVLMRWSSGEIPRVQSHPTRDIAEGFPETPLALQENRSALLDAVRDTMASCERNSTRYALDCVRLDGDRGTVAGTDSRQLLIVEGFRFPWKGHVLLPWNNVFTAKPLRVGEVVGVGRHERFIVLRSGPWTLWLREGDGHFPRVDDVVPNERDARTTLRIDETDAAFAAEQLPTLPTVDGDQGVTVDLNGHVAIRANDGGQGTELVLSRSAREGDEVRFATDRRLLARALALGFRSVSITQPEHPLLCSAPGRRFVWIPLTAGDEADGTDPVRIVSDPEHQPPTRRRTMTQPTNGRAEANGEATLDELIDETTTLVDTLGSVRTRARELLSGLKKQRKRSKLVRNTLASLRQLQAVEV